MRQLPFIILLMCSALTLSATNLDVLPLEQEYFDSPQSYQSTEHTEIIEIEPIVIDATLYDSLFAQWQKDNLFLNIIDSSEDTTVDFSKAESDSVYKARLNQLLSPVHLPYNQILKRFIVSYTTNNKAVISHALTRAQYYFPIIEPQLIENDLPLELRMMPVVESVLRPVARSRMGAAGIWQFMYATGKIYKLEISSFIDERLDPVASTQAACRFLKDLYNIYGDWTLAIAAYNCGPGNVNKAIRRANDKVENFWDIYPYLPRETRSYVPLIVAANYAFNYHLQHNIKPHEQNIILHTDTVQINKLTHLEQVASTLDISMDVLKALNPQYKKDIIPAVEKSYPLALPQGEVLRFIDHEKQIMAKDTMYLAKYIKQPSLAKMEMLAATTVHKVKSGDTLSGIAHKYNTTISNLIKWNKLKRNSVLRIGQKIEIHK